MAWDVLGRDELQAESVKPAATEVTLDGREVRAAREEEPARPDFMRVLIARSSSRCGRPVEEPTGRVHGYRLLRAGLGFVVEPPGKQPVCELTRSDCRPSTELIIRVYTEERSAPDTR
jgi:hypothetical protein